MTTEPPPRRRDGIATAAAIENAAVDLVLDHGYDAVTVDMICARARVSQRTFFNHFKTKDLAVIGTGAPSIDERAARSFIVSTGPSSSKPPNSSASTPAPWGRTPPSSPAASAPSAPTRS